RPRSWRRACGRCAPSSAPSRSRSTTAWPPPRVTGHVRSKNSPLARQGDADGLQGRVLPDDPPYGPAQRGLEDRLVERPADRVDGTGPQRARGGDGQVELVHDEERSQGTS